MERDIYKTSRLLYIIEATLEYFVSLMVAGVYLAKLTSAIGLSDSFTGILTSLVSLGCGFQIFAIFFAGRKSVKKVVTIFHTLNQLFFALIYFVPIFNLSRKVKSLIFTVLLLLGHSLNNVIHAPKINWYMSLVDDHKRGRFTANKEIVSLITGVLFNTGLGAIVDEFERVGNLNGAFIFCGVGVFVLALSHSLTLIFSKEKEIKLDTHDSVKNNIKGVLKDKTILKVVLVPVIWSIANYASTPFFGTYQVKELGFSMLLVSVISAVGAFSRAIFSRPFGKFADKRSFANLINVCLIFELLAFTVKCFVVPSNGKYLYFVYTVLFSIGMAGINSGTINLIYDYVDYEKRTSALALQSTLTGLIGFLTTFVASFLVEKIQLNGNMFLGINIYAQQVMSFISSVFILIGIIYVNLVVKKIKRN